MVGFNEEYTNYMGIPFLDTKLNISLPCMILIEEDENSRNHKIFEKLFVAQSFENLKNKNEINKISVTSKEFPIPKMIKIHQKQQHTNMKIAWRYNKTIESEKICFDMLDTLENLSEIEFSDKIKISKNTLICNLGAPHSEISNKILFDIKKQVYQNDSILLVTSPTYLNKNIQFSLYFDIILSLEQTLAKENGYHGLLRIKKFKEKPETLIFGYKITKYGIEMEEFEMAPIQNFNKKDDQLSF